MFIAKYVGHRDIYIIQIIASDGTPDPIHFRMLRVIGLDESCVEFGLLTCLMVEGEEGETTEN